MKQTSAFALAAIFSLAGCSKPVQPIKTDSRPTSGYSRFEPAPGEPIEYALDTKTGLLCRTYEKDMDTTDTKGQTLEDIPLCVDLSQYEAETIKDFYKKVAQIDFKKQRDYTNQLKHLSK